MRILIIGKVTSGQTNRLKEEGRKRGHTVENCSSYDLIINAEKGIFGPKIVGKDIAGYDLIYLLAIGQRKWEWFIACQYINQKYSTIVVEQKLIDPNYKTVFSPTVELSRLVGHGINFPKTVVVMSNKHVDEALKGFVFPVIVKNSYGHRGLGVHKAESIEDVLRIISEDKESDSFRIKEFIPNDGDVRVFTVGYKAIGAMKRMPSEGEFRSNISLGGKGDKFDLDKNREVKDMAEKMSKIMRAEIAGVDIIINKDTGVPYVIEVNRGPQFKGLEKYAGVNAAEEIIKYFEMVYNNR